MGKILTFSYQPRPFKDPKTGKKGEIFWPVIPIRISCKKQFFRSSIDVLIDSGCDRSLFPGIILEDGMRVKISKGTRKGYQSGISGKPIEVYAHKVKLYINNKPFDTTIDFSNEYNGVPLLGRKSFFRLFEKVIFDEEKRELCLRLK